jgi:phosphatidylserine/phosphatidylglycerophosphate/cardiolipin synthase-like enzyme
MVLSGLLLLAGFGCAADSIGNEELKADPAWEQLACQSEIVQYANSVPVAGLEDEEAARDAFKADGIRSQGAKCLVWWRLGAPTDERCSGSTFPEDVEVSPRLFDGGAEGFSQIRHVRQIGPSTLDQLAEAAGGACVDAPPPPTETSAEVIFSPQEVFSESHAARIVQLLDDPNTRTADVMMYSFSQSAIKEAVLRNAQREHNPVTFRVLYDSGHLTGSSGGRLGAELEAAGIEVRRVTTALHHKAVVINGVHVPGDDPNKTIVVSGSANWSSGAVTTYDESTVFIERSAEMGLRFQREFNLLWQFSRAFEDDGANGADYFETTEITQQMIDEVDVEELGVVFTSSNFDGSPYSLRVNEDAYDVADLWVEYINNAQHSIDIFQERLRSVPIAEALMEKARTSNVQIRVYLDNQEFVTRSESSRLLGGITGCHNSTVEGTVERHECETGAKYSYAVSELFEELPNADLRIKYYARNWHYPFEQMHHKSMIIDQRYLVTGSYNLSNASEFANFENVMYFDGDRFPTLINAYLEEFERLWTLGASNNVYETLMSEIDSGTDDIPIRTFGDSAWPHAVALTWYEVDDLRNAIDYACGYREISCLRSTQRDFGQRPAFCERGSGPDTASACDFLAEKACENAVANCPSAWTTQAACQGEASSEEFSVNYMACLRRADDCVEVDGCY